MHVRSAIRQYVARLMEGITPGKVYGRVHPETPEAMPGISVSVGDESGSSAGAPNGCTSRAVRVTIASYLEGVDVDDALDTMGVLVEQVVFSDVRCGGVALGIGYGGTKIVSSASGSVAFTRLEQQFVVVYRTKDGEPEYGI